MEVVAVGHAAPSRQIPGRGATPRERLTLGELPKTNDDGSKQLGEHYSSH